MARHNYSLGRVGDYEGDYRRDGLGESPLLY